MITIINYVKLVIEISQWLADRAIQVICALVTCAVSLFFNAHVTEIKTMNIYIGNLAYTVTEDDLRDSFSEFGEVANASIINDKFSGRSKGFGFVEMPKDAEAREAIESLNGKDLNGRTVTVNEAKPREERAPRRDRY